MALIQRLLGASLLIGCLNAGGTWAMSAAQYREQGIRYRNQAQLPAAIASFQKAVESDPQNVNGYVNLGWTLHLAKRRSEAIPVLEKAIWLNPFSPQTFNALGIVYLVDGNLSSAVLTHTWATMLNQNNEIAYYNLSLAFERLGIYDSAIACGKRAAELEPQNPHPWVALAIAHYGNQDQQLTQQNYQRAIDLDGRYRDSAFLNYLDEAGFSKDQIIRTQQVLKLQGSVR
jgi:tetratricopeptide (TPR) repeat protein